MPQRSLLLDAWRLVAAFLVISIHVNLFRHSAPTLSFYLVNGLARTAVPFFFVATGYFLAECGPGRLRWMIGRALRLYAIWMLLYAPIWVHQDMTAVNFARLLAFGYLHLWYLIALAEGILCGALAAKLPPRLQLWVVPLFYGIGYALQIWQLSKGQCDFNLYRNGLFDAFPLIWLGAALYRYRQTLDALPRKRLIWAFAVAFAALNLEILILHGSFAGQPADLMLSLYPLCGLGVLLLATSSLRIGTSYLARLSAAIYLVHGFVIVLLTPRLHGGETGDFLVTCLAATLLAVLVVCLNGQAHNRWLSLI